MRIELSAYQANWPQKYQDIRQEILASIGDHVTAIEHVGSTSIPNLIAKPVIDVQVGLISESYLDQIVAPMIERGFTYDEIYTPLVPERRMFQLVIPKGKESPEPPGNVTDSNYNIREHFNVVANIHIVAFKSSWWYRHLLFRDTLRENNELRDQYQQLKQDLSQQNWESVNDYAAAKTAFIREVKTS